MNELDSRICVGFTFPPQTKRRNIYNRERGRQSLVARTAGSRTRRRPSRAPRPTWRRLHRAAPVRPVRVQGFNGFRVFRVFGFQGLKFQGLGFRVPLLSSSKRPR